MRYLIFVLTLGAGACSALGFGDRSSGVATGRSSAGLTASITSTATDVLPPFGHMLEEFYHPADGQDYAPAFERLQVEVARLPPMQKTAGTTIFLAPHSYPIARPLDVCINLRIIGPGGPQRGPAAQIVTTGPFTAIRNWGENRCPFTVPFAEKATGVLALENVAVIDYSFSPSATTLRHGIEVHWGMYLRDVYVRGFVHGIHVDADATVDSDTPYPTNANTSVFENVHVESSQHAGIYIYGSDANVINVIGGSASSSCNRGDFWAPTYRPTKYCEANPTEPVCTDPKFSCAGYVDISFLGGTYVGPHTANNKDLVTARKFAGYVVVGESNRTVLIAPYSESISSTDSGANYAAANVSVYGGHSEWIGPGFVQHGRSINSVTSRNEKDPANITEYSIGASNNGGSFNRRIAYANTPSGSGVWEEKYDVTGGLKDWFCERYKNSGALPGRCLAGDKSKILGTTLVPQGTTWMPGPALYIGGTANPIRIGVGPSKPALDATWTVGSRWMRTGTSSVGAVVEYVVTNVGGVKQWRAAARVQ